MDSSKPVSKESQSQSDIVSSPKDKLGTDSKKEKTPDTVDEIELRDMPPEVRSQFQAFMAMTQSRPVNPLFSKFTEAHIDKYLDYIQRDDDNAHDLKKSNRWFYLTYFILILGVLAATVVYLLPKDKDFLGTILQTILTLAGGIGAGYGLSKKEK